ncbi:MAG: hypothetical protein IID09_01155 [Candidatus Hydrogenedentes bacterium]|nr:hypothetical protein [Candidatus Hydrogenedentota bacterium]
MSKEEILKKVLTAKRYRKMVLCYRKCLEGDDCYDRGYVVDGNERYVLLHIVDDRIELDGYVVLRTEDITEVLCEFDNYKFIEKALAIRRMEPERPTLVDLTSMEAVLRSIDEHFPLLVVHREEVNGDECWIGSLDSVAEKTFTLRAIDRDAKWSGAKRIRFDEVTRVEFDGGYETALAQVAGIH